jgi:aldose 1-epimerase
MADRPRVRIETWRGQAAVVLAAAGMQATVLPSWGMLGSALLVDGEPYLDVRGGLRSARSGAGVGLPLLHPWANRLSSERYAVGATVVDLAESADAISRDARGLPMHGTMTGPVPWEPVALGTTDAAASFTARFRYDESAGARFTAFPFPHDVVVTVSVDGALSVHTLVRPTGAVSVPVSFGWHPWFRIPGARRSHLRLELPAHQHVELDERMIPTGRADARAASSTALGEGTLDEHLVLGGPGLALCTRSRRLVVRVDEGYPFAQVHSPAGTASVCLEPMTARIDALVAGATPMVAPGAAYEAHVTVSVERR